MLNQTILVGSKTSFHSSLGVSRQLRLDGAVKARYEGRYVEIAECGERPSQSRAPSQPVRKDHNGGGKSRWMEGFWERPGPELWRAIRDANATR